MESIGTSEIRNHLNVISTISLANTAICALLAASATTQKSFCPEVVPVVSAPEDELVESFLDVIRGRVGDVFSCLDWRGFEGASLGAMGRRCLWCLCLSRVVWDEARYGSRTAQRKPGVSYLVKERRGGIVPCCSAGAVRCGVVEGLEFVEWCLPSRTKVGEM